MLAVFRRSARINYRPPCLNTRYRLYSVSERYAEKLASKARSLGVSVDELLDQAKPKAEEIKRSDVADLVKQASKFKKPSQKVSETPAEFVESAIESSSQKSKTTMDLNTFIDVEKFRCHSAKEIEMLWKARFLNSSTTFSGSMLPAPFSRLYVNARKYPTFVLPLPHKTHGVELHYVQWSFVSSQTIHCLITSLAQYKLHNEYANPHTTFMIHTDLAAENNIVLTNYIVQDNQVSAENAAILVLNLQRFYTAESGDKLDLLRKFNTGDSSFSVDKLIEVTETLD